MKWDYREAYLSVTEVMMGVQVSKTALLSRLHVKWQVTANQFIT